MSELHQQLWEFAYDLLPEEEAGKLRERICSDPEVARAYATVKLQTELVECASRLETPTVAWHRPDEGRRANKSTDSAESLAGVAIPASESRRQRASARTAAQWVVSVAAAALVVVMFSPWLTLGPRQDELAQRSSESADAVLASTGPVETTLVGPSSVNPEVSNYFAVRTKTASGEPLTTNVEYRFYDTDNQLSYAETTQTDVDGNARVALPQLLATKVARVEVAAADTEDFLSRPLQLSRSEQVTYLRIDKPICRPSERIKYRSVTLSRFGLRVEDEADVRYAVTDPKGKRLASSENTMTTENGVGEGSFEIPPGAVDGEYAVVVQSPTQQFPEEWQTFEVRGYQTPRFKKTLELARDSYTPGDTVEADLLVEYADGSVVADARLKLDAVVDDQPLDLPESKTDAKGNAKLTFNIPEEVEAGLGRLSVTVEDKEGVAETISERVPINLGKVNVEFFPEGGRLVAGLPSRVYFHARDPLGKAVHIEGRIVDSSGEVLERTTTIHEGRGMFSLLPVADEGYWLEIDKPVGVTKRIELPAADSKQFVTLQTGGGVFGESAPIALQICTLDPSKPLVAACYCRGTLVGQLTIDATDYVAAADGVRSTRVELEPAPEAQGVIRVTLFDQSATPIVPIAERLVYRRVRRKLHVNVLGLQERYDPGSDVQLQIAVTDEGKSPRAAIAGVSVVDDAILTLGEDKSTRMPTYFHLLTDIENPQDLEDANFYLSQESGADKALDLLLATQGWRRFIELPVDELAGFLPQQSVSGFRYAIPRLADDRFVQAVRSDVDQFPFVAVKRSKRAPLASAAPSAGELVKTSEAQSPRRTRFARGAVLSLGGSLLLFVLAATAIACAGFSRKVLVPVGGVAVASLIVGLIWTRQPGERGVTAGPGRTYPASATAEPTDAAVLESLKLPPSVEVEAAQAEEAAPGPELDAGARATFQRKLAARPTDGEQEDNLPPSPAPVESAPAESAVDETAGRKKGGGASPAAASPRVELMLTPPEPSSEPRGVRQRVAEPLADAITLREGQQDLFTREELSRRQLVRAFAKDYRLDRLEGAAAQQSATTILWEPSLRINDTGISPMRVKLPAETRTFRAIIEAHGDERLGATETIIVARPNE